MTESTIDRASLSAWLSEQGRELTGCQPLAGDVSPRSYARVELEDGSGAIAAGYGPETGDACWRFVRSTALLQQASIPVPRILAADCERGWMLLEDVGPETLFDLDSRPLEARLDYFEEAVRIARRLSALPADPVAELNPPLDAGLLLRELRQTIDAFLEPRGLIAGLGDRPAFEGALEALCAALGAKTPVPCHRDFMSRNLVPRPDGGVVVLDHQDLRLGPPGYDLASLLNDSFYPPTETEAALLGEVVNGERLGYHRAAVQRTLKAVGTFASFAALGSERHLPLIPPTLRRTLRHMERVPEFTALLPRLRELWEPVTRPRGG